jgi:acyl-coenzyme A synthetase/AMP-(fatty) acid ligase
MPLFPSADPVRPIALRSGRQVLLAGLREDVSLFAASLPQGGGFLVNLCEDRYLFLVAYYGAIARGWTNLLPHTRAAMVVAEVAARHSGCVQCRDSMVLDALSANLRDASSHAAAAAGHVAMIGYTSGSTGIPQPFPQQWWSLVQSTARNAEAIRARLPSPSDDRAWIVATVPPQHVYGMEMSVLLPVLGDMAVHCGRPMFPQDVAEALAEVPEPRVLVTTPVHLRVLAESGIRFAKTALIVSATASLDAPSAARAEQAFDSTVLEIYGSTETCALAQRRTASGEPWRLHEGVRLVPGDDSTVVEAPWLSRPVELQDLVELGATGQFRLRGRSSDLIEVAGKRASLGDLTRRLLEVPGVDDAVVVQLDSVSSGVRRIAALAVAPGLSAAEVLAELALRMDPVFLPRPLVLVASLPRNELGKLPRQRVINELSRRAGHRDGA